MSLEEKIKDRQFKRYWEKEGRKDLFTWVHRYLRLHSELLKDNVYQNIYEYCRGTLITYLKKDIKNKKYDDVKLGELIDALADVFNKEEMELVNKYNIVVDELYKLWKNPTQ